MGIYGLQVTTKKEVCSGTMELFACFSSFWEKNSQHFFCDEEEFSSIIEIKASEQREA